jgi:cation transport regulator ChaB
MGDNQHATRTDEVEKENDLDNDSSQKAAHDVATTYVRREDAVRKQIHYCPSVVSDDL